MPTKKPAKKAARKAAKKTVKKVPQVTGEVPLNHCQRCGKAIPNYPECLGGVGFVSPKSDEAKITQSGGLRALEVIERQVCKPCYIVEYSEKYPNAECPVSE